MFARILVFFFFFSFFNQMSPISGMESQNGEAAFLESKGQGHTLQGTVTRSTAGSLGEMHTQ